MNLFFVAASRDPSDGCRNYRITAPANMLSLRGHIVRINSSMSSQGQPLDTDGEHGPWDVVVAQRVHLGGPAKEFMRLASLSNGPTMLVEMDDLLTDVHPTNVGAFDAYSRPSVRNRIIETIRASHGVICSTQRLAEEMLELGAPGAWVFENCVDETTIIDEPRSMADSTVLGWGGGFSHRIDVERIAYPVKTVLRRYPDTILHTVGADYSKMMLPKGGHHRHTEWTKTVLEYVQLLSVFDIGLAPLYPNRFNSCKSHLKPLEYMSQGVVPVASRFGPYEDFIEDGVSGFLASGDKEWVDRLSELLSDEQMRVHMARNAIEQSKRWTYQHRIIRYEDILSQALAARAR